jgi:alpha-mannosidase
MQATHHDGMSGTERQSVADDYEQRISESHFEVEAGVALSLKKLSGFDGDFGHCNCNEQGNCLNMSVCTFTTGVDGFAVVAWNPLGQSATPWLRLPVSGGGSWSVTDASSSKPVASQLQALDNRTLQIPLLYINHFGLNAKAEAAAQVAYANNATDVLTFAAELPAVGYKVYTVVRTAAGAHQHHQQQQRAKRLEVIPATVSNGIYEIALGPAGVSSVTNIASGVSTPLTLNWGYYQSSPGGTTYLLNGTAMKSNQASGAYLFRPIYQNTTAIAGAAGPTVEVVQGPLVTEIRQTFSEWATHVIRLKNGSRFIEVEWTAGPIPMGGKALPPLPAPGGCVGWEQTVDCDSHGKLDPKKTMVGGGPTLRVWVASGRECG